MPTLPDYLGVSWVGHQSPGLPYGSPYLLDKIIFWAFLSLSLRFSLFLAQKLNFCIRSTVSGAFLHWFSHWQRLYLASKRWSRIFMVCNSCKNSYNVLSHSHICQGCGGGRGVHVISRGGGGGGVVKNRESPDFRSPEVGISVNITRL